jgi:hypothetical protein
MLRGRLQSCKNASIACLEIECDGVAVYTVDVGLKIFRRIRKIAKNSY